MAIQQLFVIWGDPQGNRFVIGHLTRSADGFRFWYEADLTRAKARGFETLLEFPELRGESVPYERRYLFPVFAERIPAPSRPDAKAMMAAWGVDRPDDPFEVLAKSGGIRATDRIELAEYRPPDDALSQPLEFRVASRRHLTDLVPLAVGDAVSLHGEPTNEADPQAVIVDKDGKRAGYVPRQYAALFTRLLATSVMFDGQVVRKLIVPEDAGKWVVRIARRA